MIRGPDDIFIAIRIEKGTVSHPPSQISLNLITEQYRN